MPLQKEEIGKPITIEDYVFTFEEIYPIRDV